MIRVMLSPLCSVQTHLSSRFICEPEWWITPISTFVRVNDRKPKSPFNEIS